MISVVIITKNEARVIAESIRSCRSFSDDIVVLDSGSTDDTVSIAKNEGANVFEQDWLGYGPQKNCANAFAKHDWILSLDADERPDGLMIKTLKTLDFDQNKVYCFKLIDHFGERAIKYSELRPKWKKRLFNKNRVHWDDRTVHEQLILDAKIKLRKCQGMILHYSYETFGDFEKKIRQYAELGAEEMILKKKNLSLFKRLFNPSFRFIRSYLLYGGFLEGKMGYRISKTLSDGLRIKYLNYDKQKA